MKNYKILEHEKCCAKCEYKTANTCIFKCPPETIKIIKNGISQRCAFDWCFDHYINDNGICDNFKRRGK